VQFHGVRPIGDWRIKLYSVVYGDGPVEWNRFAKGIEMASAALPARALAPGRPGAGFLIAHQGKTACYTVLAWWDRENELPLRVFVNPNGQGDVWRQNAGDESVCVWDLEVIWAEREAYVRTVLSPGAADVEAYLERSNFPIVAS
jgi:hypothetical protein